MDFLADKSVQRILLIAAGVIGLFVVYFLLAVLSNRSVRQTATILRRRREGRPDNIHIRPTPGVLSWPWAVAVLLLSAAGLVTLLVYSTTVYR